jgi:hypothetical protein
MASNLLDTLAAELSKLKVAGHTAIALDPLITYVSGLVESARASDPEDDRQRIRINFEGQLEKYRAEVQGNLEMFKAVLETGQSALKALSVINGAAAIAILAFLGNVLAHPSKEGLAAVPSMSRAMVWFATGVGLAGVGFAARYLSQASFAGDLWSNAATAGKGGIWLRVLAIAGGLFSLVLFFVGIGAAFNAVR